MPEFLSVQKGQIVQQGQPVRLQGVNLGGWLMMEGYILHSPNRAEHLFKRAFAGQLGSDILAEFEHAYRSHFIQSDDFATIAEWGMNCVRLPFNCRLVELPSGEKNPDGLHYLDMAIRWAKKAGIRVILDLHAAWGAQNHDWHSDSDGSAQLWSNPEYQRRTVALWEFLADRYRYEPAVAGYDLLNEAVVEDAQKLNAFYRDVIKAIRRCDHRHIIFVEGNRWATDLACLDPIEDPNFAFSIHYYEPLEFTFNFVPSLRYPLSGAGGVFDVTALHNRMAVYAKLAQKYQVPVLAGEFGVHYRDGYYGEDRWLADLLQVWREYGFHWTYWTYKAVKNSIFPDGVMSYYDNPPWVNRQGASLGWETYSQLWPQRKMDMISSWESPAFRPNEKILAVLKDAVRL